MLLAVLTVGAAARKAFCPARVTTAYPRVECNAMALGIVGVVGTAFPGIGGPNEPRAIVEYITLRGNNPALGLLALGVGRKCVMRRAVIVEAVDDEGVPLKSGLTVGVTVCAGAEPTLVPKNPPSMVMGSCPSVAS